MNRGEPTSFFWGLVRRVCLLLLPWSLLPAAGSAQTGAETASPVVQAGGASGGVRAYRPGRWGVVSVAVANPSDRPSLVEVSYHFDPEPEVDYGDRVTESGELEQRQRATQGTLAPQYKFTRRIWLPPRSRRMTHCPVMPPNVQASGAYNAICTAVDVTSGEPRLLPDATGKLQRAAVLTIPIDRLVSGVFMDPQVHAGTRDDGAYDALIASRVHAGLSRRIALVDQYMLPATREGFAALDHLLIDNLVPLNDAATLSAVQRWLLDGGRMWIMLDAVGVDSAAKLLGHEFHCAEVDRVDLSEVRFQSVRDQSVSEPVEYETPVPMLRVMVEDAQVLYQVNGWPAAFVQNFGLGQVVFTTIDPRAMVRPTAASDPRPASADLQTNFVALDELEELSSLMYGTLPAPPLEPEGLRPFLAQQIGYRIVGRTPILLILSAFVGSLAVAGVLVHRRPATLRLTWVAPVLALLATIPIAVLGMTRQKSIPNTVAVGQILPIVPGHDEIQVNGMLAFYHQSPTNLQAGSLQGGWFLPEIPANDQTVHEVVWDDFDRWDWRNFRVPPSVISGPFARSSRYSGEPCRLEATFNERGLVGRVIGGDWKSIEDPILVVPSNRGLALSMAADGSFVGAPDRVLASGQYVGADILSDEQRRRQNLLREVFEQAAIHDFPTRPTLMFWTRPLDQPFPFAKGIRQTGDALAYGPLELKRPEAGSRVTIPHSFLPLKPVAGPQSRGVSSSYQTTTGAFARVRAASDTWLRAQLPTSLLPLELDRLEVRLQINAPSRTLTIAAAQNGRLVRLDQFRNPSGVITATIDRAEFLQLDQEGGLLVGLLVGDADSETAQDAEWQIHDLQLTAAGRVP